MIAAHAKSLSDFLHRRPFSAQLPHLAHVVLVEHSAGMLGSLGARAGAPGAALGPWLAGEVFLECPGGLIAVKTPKPAVGALKALFGVDDTGLATAKATWKTHQSSDRSQHDVFTGV